MTKKDQPRAAQQAPNKCMKGVKMECQGKGNDLNLTGPAGRPVKNFRGNMSHQPGGPLLWSDTDSD